MLFYLGAISVFAVIIVIGVMTGRKMKKATSFDSVREATPGLVAGALIGTLVGGSSTIGTAQLAYTYGFSAWWFTLGGAIGVIVLGLVFLIPLYNSGINTLPDVFSRVYGKKSGVAVAVLSSLGTFLSFVAQIISGTALIMSITPLDFSQSLLVVSALMIVYVFFGGSLALGRAGLAKTILLAASVLICGILAIRLGGGLQGCFNNAELPHAQYFNLFARGLAIDLGSGISLVIGVITTQSYIAAVLSAKNISSAKGGILLTAILVPIIGLAGIFVGMYMKIQHPGIDAKLALPMFILNELPPMVAGVMIASLLVAVIGTGAGLSMGIASMIYRNIYRIVYPENNDAKRVTQMILLSVITIGALLCYANLDDLILGWSFMSMGLRGSVAAVPMIVAVFLPGKVAPRYAITAMFAGVIFTMTGKFVIPLDVDPMFYGIGASLVIMVLGIIVNRRKKGVQ